MKKLLHPGRPAGRLFYCLVSVLVAVSVSRGAPPQAPPATTTISDVIYRANGSTAAGTLLITWPAFTTADNRAVPAGSMSLAIGPFGAINLALAPNQGATPAGTYYKVVMKLNDGTTSEEFWVVPTLSPTTISAIRSQVVPAGVALQVVTRQYVDDQLAATVHRTGDETVNGVKQFASSPTVPTPTADPDAANKAYVDAAVTSGNGNNYVLKTGDTMSGALNTPGLAAARINGVRYADQFASIQAAISDAGSSGSVVIPASYAGTDTFTNPNGIFITDLRKAALNTVNVKMWGAKGDGRAAGVNTVSGNATITSVGDSPWVAGDVGKTIVLYSQTFSPGLVTTIASFTDSSHIVLAAAPSLTINGVEAVWGTDDSTAISSAAATITAKGNIGTLHFPQGIYLNSAPLTFLNAQGLRVVGDGAGSSASLNNYSVGGSIATGTSLVWTGGQGGVIGCTGNTGAPPPGIANASQNCTAAENYMLKLSGQFTLQDINFQGAQRASHDVLVGGGDASASFDWNLQRVNFGYARQYGLVIGGTGADQPGNFGESYLESLSFSANGLPNTTVAENDATGGGDIFQRWGSPNFQSHMNTGYVGIGSVNGNHHIFHYSGNSFAVNNYYFAPLLANGTPHSSIYVLGGLHHILGNLYDENGYLIHVAGGDDFDFRHIQARTQATTNPHQAMQFDTAVNVNMNGVFTQGLPIVFSAGGNLNSQQVQPGQLGALPAYPTTLCAGAGCTTRSGSTVTVGDTGHPYKVNDWVQLNNFADATYNGTFKVTGITANSFTVDNPAAVGASTQGGTAALACCLIAATTTDHTSQDSHPFLSLRALWNGIAVTQADTFSAVTTNLAAKNSIVLVPATVSGAAGASMPAAIPAGWNFLDMRGGVPTWLGGTFAYGTAANPATVNLNNTLNVIGKAATNQSPVVISGSTVGYNSLHITNTGGNALLAVNDSTGGAAISGGTAYSTILTSNNATPLELGTNDTSRYQISATGHLLATADNAYDIGASGATRPRTGYFGTSIVTPLVRIPEGTAPAGLASSDLLWGDPVAHRLKVNNNNGGASTLALFTDKLSVFATTSSAELAGVLSDETGAGKAMFNAAPVLQSYTVSTLPAAGIADRIAIVTDAASAGSCTSGGGSSRAFCRDTGSAWEPLGDGGGGGGTPGGSDTQVQYNNAGVFGGISNGSAGQCLTSNGAGAVPSFQACGAGGGANPALSNLASVAVNAALIPGADGTLDLGSSSLNWRNLYGKGAAALGPAASSFSATAQTYISPGINSLRTLNTATGGPTAALTSVMQDNNTANTIWGVLAEAEAQHTSGTKNNVVGVEADAIALGSGGTIGNLKGFDTYIEQGPGTTIGTAINGLRTAIQIDLGATSTNAVYGVHVAASNLDAATTVPVVAGLRVDTSTKSAGTITNNIGVDIADQTAGATNYAIRTGLGLVSFGDTTSAPILNASTGYRVAGGAASGNVLRGNGTNFVSATLACADVTNCAPLAASGTAGAGPSKAGTASTAARSDHDHRSFHTLTWFFPGTPSTGVSPMILAVPQGIVNGTITGMQVTVATTSASSSTFNLQRCTANCTGTSPTFANIYSSDNTLGANTSEADFGTTNLTTTVNAKDQFKANLVTIGSGLANVTLTLTYKYDTAN